jgi:hypothetical protein
MSFRKGNAKKKIRALKYYFLQSWVCSMGWSGDRERERGVATSHFQSHNDTISAKKKKFRSRKIVLFARPDFIPFHKKGNPQKGFAPSFPIPELQSKKHPILSHKAFIPHHSTEGMRRNNFTEPEKCFFCKARFADGLVWRQREKSCNISFPVSQRQRQKDNLSDREKIVLSPKPGFIPQVQGVIPISDPRIAVQKNDFIPKRVVHLFSFRKGNAENFSERLKYFLQSRACLMGWPGDRPAFYMFTRCTFPPPNPLPLSSIYTQACTPANTLLSIS